MTVKLVAKTGFHSFGKDYPTGSVVDPQEAAKWPDGTMATRLNNGYLEYKDVADEETGPAGEETNYEKIQREDSAKRKDDTDPTANMNEAQLRDFMAANSLSVDLDKIDGNIRSKRNAVSEAYKAKMEATGGPEKDSGPVGGQAGSVDKVTIAKTGDV